jgi:SAM-dependent methyltransferase
MGKTVWDVARWWDERPCNVLHSNAPVGSLEYSREVTRVKLTREPHIVAFMEPWRWIDKFVIDAGCGIGTCSLIFASFGAVVAGVDVSARSLEIARMRAEAEGAEIAFARQNLEQLTVPFPHPDLIFSFGVVHHTPHPDVALRELRRIAGPDTELRIMLYHRWSTKGIRLGLTNKRIARGSEARPDSPITFAYSRRQARRLLESSGWHVEKLWVDHIFPYRTDELQRGVLKRGFPWNVVPPALMNVVARLLGWHLLIVAKPKENE